MRLLLFLRGYPAGAIQAQEVGRIVQDGFHFLALKLILVYVLNLHVPGVRGQVINDAPPPRGRANVEVPVAGVFGVEVAALVLHLMHAVHHHVVGESVTGVAETTHQDAAWLLLASNDVIVPVIVVEGCVDQVYPQQGLGKWRKPVVWVVGADPLKSVL